MALLWHAGRLCQAGVPGVCCERYQMQWDRPLLPVLSSPALLQQGRRAVLTTGSPQATPVQGLEPDSLKSSPG